MADSVDTIAQATGLKRLELLDIWAEVKANHQKLEGCTRHEFQLIEPAQPLRNKFACSVCGGVVHQAEYHWYMLGRAHGS